MRRAAWPRSRRAWPPCRRLPGARLNLTTGKLAVTFDGKDADPAAVVRAVEGMGYRASLYDPAAVQEDYDREGRRLLLALGVAGFGAANVMMFTVPTWAGLFGQEMQPATRTVLYWLAAIVATPCALYAGALFFTSAWSSLRRGRANMDVPITIGVLLTLIVSYSETYPRRAPRLFRRRHHPHLPASDRPLARSQACAHGPAARRETCWHFRPPWPDGSARVASSTAYRWPRCGRRRSGRVAGRADPGRRRRGGGAIGPRQRLITGETASAAVGPGCRRPCRGAQPWRPPGHAGRGARSRTAPWPTSAG